jgi:hypothetical protein
MLKIIGFILSFLGLIIVLIGIFLLKKQSFIFGGCALEAIAMGLLYYKSFKLK